MNYAFIKPDKDDKRLFRLCCAGLILLFLITPFKVQAETGSMTLSDVSTVRYSFGGAGDVATSNFTVINFDIADYSYISSFTMGYGDTFGMPFESTTFTCVEGCVGGGISWYDQNSSKLYWVFDSSTTFSASYIKLSYATNIYVNASHLRSEVATGVNVNNPIRIMNNNNQAYTSSNVNEFGYYYSTVGNQETDAYTVTYPMAGYFNVSVNKGGTITTKYFIENQSSLSKIKSRYSEESTFNKNSFSFISKQYDGIYLNMTVATGNYLLRLVNSTVINPDGSVYTAPFAVNNPALTIPSSGGSIQFNKTQYTVGDTVRFEWAISNSSWQALGSTFKIFLFKNNNPALIDGTSALQVPSQQQQGNYSFVSTEVAGLTVKLYGGDWSTLFAASNLLGTAYTSVLAEAPATVFVNSSVPYKTQVPVTYNFGVGGINGLDYAIQTYYFDRALNEYQFEHSYFGLSQSGTRNVFFENIGTYIIKLRNVRTGKEYARTTTEATFTFPDTVLSISTSSLKTSKSSYSYGDTIFGNYTVDNTNFTSGVTYLDVFNIDQQAVTSEFYGSGASWSDTSKQIGDVLITVLNVPKSENFPAVTFLDGNNNLRLMMKNATGNRTVLAYTNFTLSSLSSTGYNLRLSKNTVQVNEQFFAYVTTPEPAKLVLVDTATASRVGILIAKVNQSKTVPITINKVGNYAILLNNPANDTEYMQNVKVVEKALVPTPTVSAWSPEPTNPGYTAGIIDGQVSLLGMGVNNSTRFLFSMVWVILFLVGGFVVTGRNANGGLYAAMLPFLFFVSLSFIQAGVEYIPRYVVIIIAFILVIKLGIVR